MESLCNDRWARACEAIGTSEKVSTTAPAPSAAPDSVQNRFREGESQAKGKWLFCRD